MWVRTGSTSYRCRALCRYPITQPALAYSPTYRISVGLLIAFRWGPLSLSEVREVSFPLPLSY